MGRAIRPPRDVETPVDAPRTPRVAGDGIVGGVWTTGGVETPRDAPLPRGLPPRGVPPRGLLPPRGVPPPRSAPPPRRAPLPRVEVDGVAGVVAEVDAGVDAVVTTGGSTKPSSPSWSMRNRANVAASISKNSLVTWTTSGLGLPFKRDGSHRESKYRFSHSLGRESAT